MARSGDELGFGFWVKAALAVFGVAVGVFLVFWIFGRIWYGLGFFGAFAFMCIILLAIGWYYDRREARSME